MLQVQIPEATFLGNTFFEFVIIPITWELIGVSHMAIIKVLCTFLVVFDKINLVAEE